MSAVALLLNLATASPLMGVLSPPYRDWNSKMKVLRTPETRFTNLPDYPFAPSFLQITPELRLHYVDEGPRDAIPVLMLHGEPTWSYLYRHMIPAIAQAGLRALAPDLIGFGKSDKPAERTDQVAWIRRWVEAMELRNIILVCQDWGSLIGLRVAAETPELNHWGHVNADQQMLRNAAYIKTHMIDSGRMGLMAGKGYYDYPNPAYEAPDFLSVPPLSSVPGVVARAAPKNWV